MNTDKINEQNTEIDFSIIQIFSILWRRKILIIFIVIVTTLISGVFSIFIISPIYNCNLNIVVNIPDIYKTKYGDYTLPISTNQQYIKLIQSNIVLTDTIRDMGYNIKEVSIEDLRERIKIDQLSNATDVEQNSFEINVSAKNPEEAHKLALTIYNNYVKFLDITTLESSINYFSEQFITEKNLLTEKIASNKELLKSYKELLKKIPQTIDHKDALNDIKDQIGTNDVLILGDVSNPNYIQMENDILVLEETIERDENTIKLNEKYLEIIAEDKKIIENYYNSDNKYSETTISSITATSVSLPSSPVIPTRKIGPSISKNIILGMFFGILLGCFIALLKNYWLKRSQPVNK